jgi:hypothetical protein
MALDDFIEPEVGIAVAVTAAVSSPKVRGAIRKGLVYGVAGVLMAGDAIAAVARRARESVDGIAHESQDMAQHSPENAPEPPGEGSEGEEQKQSRRRKGEEAAANA